MNVARSLSPSTASEWQDAPEDQEDQLVAAEREARSVEECVSLHFLELNDRVFRYSRTALATRATPRNCGKRRSYASTEP